jgi:protein-S-isoprenylcysteine O-methyltransferase Ste14
MLKRTVFFVYGCAAYLVFVATFLYAIAFIGGFIVPTRLDGVPRMPLGSALAIDAALLTIFAVQHSVMARRWFKVRWMRFIHPSVERATYVLFSSVALTLLCWEWQPLGGVVWSIESLELRALVWAAFAAGWAIVLTATILINHFELFGLRQVWRPLIGRPSAPATFTTPGLYRLTRHPLYLGFLLAFWSAPTMTTAHLLFAIATTAYVLIAIQLEERDLVREYGETYRRYQRRVPMILPLLGPQRLHDIDA